MQEGVCTIVEQTLHRLAPSRGVAPQPGEIPVRTAPNQTACLPRTPDTVPGIESVWQDDTASLRIQAVAPPERARALVVIQAANCHRRCPDPVRGWTCRLGLEARLMPWPMGRSALRALARQDLTGDVAPSGVSKFSTGPGNSAMKRPQRVDGSDSSGFDHRRRDAATESETRAAETDLAAAFLVEVMGEDVAAAFFARFEGVMAEVCRRAEDLAHIHRAADEPVTTLPADKVRHPPAPDGKAVSGQTAAYRGAGGENWAGGGTRVGGRHAAPDDRSLPALRPDLRGRRIPGARRRHGPCRGTRFTSLRRSPRRHSSCSIEPPVRTRPRPAKPPTVNR